MTPARSRTMGDRFRWGAPRRLRARLTLWYVGLMVIVLAVFVIGTSWVMYAGLRTQLNRYIVQDLETIEGLVVFDQYAHPYLRQDYHNPPDSRFILERYFEILSPDGTVLFRNERLGGGTLGGAPLPGEGEDGDSTRMERLADGTRVMLVSRRHSFDGIPTLLRLAYSMEPVRQRVRDWVVDTLWSLSVMLVLAGLAGYSLVRRALVPIDRMAQRVEEITPERLHERLPVGQIDDELAHLARVFNQLLDRVEESFERLRRFTSDASHELRTPLAAMRSVGEVALQLAETPEHYRDVIGSMLEEVNRLTALADNLLDLARADRGTVQLRHAVLPVFGLVREATGIVDVLMEDKSQQLVLTGDQDASVSGDAVFLRQALVNIVHNAVKYSPIGGTIRVHVGRSADNQVVVEVADSGPGIAKEHFSKLFDRFYRVEESRPRDGAAGGTGLGLSIARWAVEAHGGTIDLDSTPGQGSVFRISLPRAA